jgi:protocatechuate 3,4-dioxygenase, alpha subunit
VSEHTRLETTPSQTIGPFFHFALFTRNPFGKDLSELVAPDHPDAVRVEGVILDGAGEPVSDAMVEIWQANAAGRYNHPEDDRDDAPLDEAFTGFGRVPTDGEGKFSFVTVKPGSVPGPDGVSQAPHILVSVFARGLLKRLATRMYFPEEREANERDPVLSSVEDPGLRPMLVAREEDGILRFDIRLQGERQTVFFDV